MYNYVQIRMLQLMRNIRTNIADSLHDEAVFGAVLGVLTRISVCIRPNNALLMSASVSPPSKTGRLEAFAPGKPLS